MSMTRTFGVACSWLLSVSGCALQSEADPPGVAEVPQVTTDELRRKPTLATPAPTSTSAQPSAPASSVCGSGVTLAPGMTPPGYKLTSITVGSTTSLMLVPDATAQSTPLPAGYRVECATNSEGGRFVQLIPPPTPTVIVYPGGQCGIVNREGVLLQCVTGSACVSAGNNQPGICQPYPTAPNNQL